MPDHTAHDIPGNGVGGKLTWLVISTTLAILWSLYQDSGDPFGLDTFLETLSANSYTMITSPFFGKSTTVEIEGKHYSSRRGQAEVIVLLIDDHYLNTTQQTWPLSPSKFSRTLRKLANAEAAAVFFDIYFAPGDALKAKQVDMLFDGIRKLEQSSNTEFFFASTWLDPDLSKYRTNPPQAAMAQTASALNVYPLSQAASGGVIADTAGWALYKAWCKRAANTPHCPKDIQLREGGDDMYLLWGYAPNEIMTGLPEFGGQDCIKQSTTLVAKMAASLRLFAWLATKGYQTQPELSGSGSVVNAIAPCPYHSQISLGLFNNLTASELTALFKNKIVVLGTSISIFTDYQSSPVHGFVPGAFWHAAAADNLIEFGDGYLRDAQGYEGAEQLGIILMIIINSILSLLIIQIDRRQGCKARQIESLQIAHGVFVFCVISATVLYFVWYDRVSPANWAGFALLLMMVAGESLVAMWNRFSRVLPIPIAKPMLHIAINGLKGVAILFVVLAICLVAFLLPQGLFLSRVSYADPLSWAMLVGYSVIGLFCVYLIVRQWLDSLGSEFKLNDSATEDNQANFVP